MALWLTQMEMNVGKCTIWSIWQNVWLILDPDPPFEKHQRLLNLIIQKVKDTGKESKQQFRAWNRQQKMLPIFTLCKGKPISWNHWVQLTDPSHSSSPSLFNKPFPSIREITLQMWVSASVSAAAVIVYIHPRKTPSTASSIHQIRHVIIYHIYLIRFPNK